MTQAELGRLIDRSAASIASYEKATARCAPHPDVLLEIAERLGRAPHYFLRSVSEARPVQEIHWRARQKASMRLRHQVEALADDVIEVVDALEDDGRLQPFDLDLGRSDFGNVSPDDLAKLCRSRWGLGRSPIPNVVDLLESRGIPVIELRLPYREQVPADAFTKWTPNERPVVFIVSRDQEPSGARCRQRLSLLHELKHIITDAHVESGDKDLEQNANNFAGAMLLPEGAWSSEFPRAMSLTYLLQLKLRWRASAKAMVYRASRLGMLSSSTATRYYIEMSQRWPGGEPAESEPPVEIRRLVSGALSARSATLAFPCIADDLGMTIQSLTTLASDGSYGPPGMLESPAAKSQ